MPLECRENAVRMPLFLSSNLLSGGPLLRLHSDGVWYLYGITSFGSENGCALEATPTAYTRVTSFLEWIFDTTGVKNTAEETFSSENVCTDSAKEHLPESLLLDLSVFDNYVDKNHTDEYCSLKQVETQFKTWANNENNVLEIQGDCADSFNYGHIRPNKLYDRRVQWRQGGKLPQYIGVCNIKCSKEGYLFHSWNGKTLTKNKVLPMTCRSAPGSGRGARIWVKDLTCKKEEQNTEELVKYDRIKCKNWPDTTELESQLENAETGRERRSLKSAYPCPATCEPEITDAMLFVGLENIRISGNRCPFRPVSRNGG